MGRSISHRAAQREQRRRTRTTRRFRPTGPAFLTSFSAAESRVSAPAATATRRRSPNQSPSCSRSECARQRAASILARPISGFRSSTPRSIPRFLSRPSRAPPSASPGSRSLVAIPSSRASDSRRLTRPMSLNCALTTPTTCLECFRGLSRRSISLAPASTATRPTSTSFSAHRRSARRATSISTNSMRANCSSTTAASSRSTTARATTTRRQHCGRRRTTRSPSTISTPAALFRWLPLRNTQHSRTPIEPSGNDRSSRSTCASPCMSPTMAFRPCSVTFAPRSSGARISLGFSRRR